MRVFLISVLFFVQFLTGTLQYSDPFKWGSHKPQLIYSLSEKDLSPITLRFAFNYANSPIAPRYDMYEQDTFDLILNYNYHNGQDFSEQTVYDKATNFQFKLLTVREKNDGPKEQWSVYAMNPQSKGFVSQILRDMIKTSGNSREGLFTGEGFLENDHGLTSKKKFSEEEAVLGFSLSLEQLIDHREQDPKDYYLSKADGENNSFIIRNKSNHEIISIFKLKFIEDETLKLDQLDFKFVRIVNKYQNWAIGEKLKNFLSTSWIDPQSLENSIDNTGLLLRVPVKLASNFLLHILYKEDLTIPTAFEDKYELIYDRIQNKRVEFVEDFIQKFPPVGVPNSLQCSISSMSNLLGGLMYMYGPIKTSSNPYQYKQPKPLFTMTPCRKGFARGFLWDEGFHNMLISQYNPSLSLEIIKHWFNTEFDNGWIPREQIRGPEIEEYANKDFLVQKEGEANPPTMIIPLGMIFKEFKEKKNIKGLKEIETIWQKVKLWFDWFEKSQRSEDQYLYRWLVSGAGLNLGSGMDDYPRNDPDFTSKYHLDLQVWIIVFAENLLPILEEFEQDVEKIEALRTLIKKSKENLHKVFKDPQDLLYKDTDGQKYSKHIGYDNLFPLFFGLIEKDSEELDAVLDILSNERKLWSKAGIRSLSISDSFYRKNDNYWTSPIWINMNYLVLSGIKKFYWDNEKAQGIYEILRGNVIKTICENWRDTGVFWETFDDQTAKGTHHSLFNGWTSLITLIISEKYI